MVPEREPEPKILVVEENEYHGLLMGRQISQRVENSQVMIAHGADEALRLARTNAFDVAVVDFVLSDCDGLSLLHSLYHLDPNLAIIVVADQLSEQITKEIFRHGCEELLIKDSSYYAVVPRMVAGLWQKKLRSHNRPPVCGDTRRYERERALMPRPAIYHEIRRYLNEILQATSDILSVSAANDSDLTDKIMGIKASAAKIRLSLDENTPQVSTMAGPREMSAVSVDISDGYGAKSRR